MTVDRILFRGALISPEWPEAIRAAQNETAIEIDGRFYERIRYGDEPDDWGASKQPCGDCLVLKGELHVGGCDVERCPRCYGQAIMCECNEDLDD